LSTTAAKPQHSRCLLDDADNGFGFVRHNRIPPKPRTKAATKIRGPYYSAMGPPYLSNVLETMGDHVDGLKFAGGSFSLFSHPQVRELIEPTHGHDVYVSAGGWMEHILSSSGADVEGAVHKYLARYKALGFDVMEISTGFLSLPGDDWL
jgi:phosphosulfolactate synthase (CoM biosynthesis protein A)